MAVKKKAKKTGRKRTLKKKVFGADRKHTVKASLRNVDLTKATSALNLVLRADGEKLGELVVGRGSIFWYARSNRSNHTVIALRSDRVIEFV